MLPKKIKVGYKTYRVIEMDANGLKESNGSWGYCQHGNGTIHVETDMQDTQEIWNTLLHEILHACFFVGGIKVDNEEYLVNTLANVLLPVLQSNDLKGITYERPRTTPKS